MADGGKQLIGASSKCTANTPCIELRKNGLQSADRPRARSAARILLLGPPCCFDASLATEAEVKRGGASRGSDYFHHSLSRFVDMLLGIYILSQYNWRCYGYCSRVRSVFLNQFLRIYGAQPCALIDLRS